MERSESDPIQDIIPVDSIPDPSRIDTNIETKSNELEDKNSASNLESVLHMPAIILSWLLPGHEFLCRFVIAFDVRGKCFLMIILMANYSEEMIESQVDQLVLDELVREIFPKLVNHLDYLGVQVAWVTSPWFLTIFMNMLPWESVLRVWDVIFFEGNCVMLFRTALDLMELYGPTLVTTKDAGDVVTLLQSLAGSTFNSRQLVLTAFMGYQNITEERLQELRNKHRPAVRASLDERSKGMRAWRDSQGLESMMSRTEGINSETNGNMSHLDALTANVDELYVSLNDDTEIDPAKDLQEQINYTTFIIHLLKRNIFLLNEDN
ncbi:hypothetical protein ACS0TY_017789 [Phlomoides rotata]